MRWNTLTGGASVILAAVLLSCASVGDREPVKEGNRELLEALFPVSGQTARISGPLRERYSTLPAPLAERVGRFGERYDAFRSLLPPPGSVSGVTESPASVAMYEKRAAVERAIRALSDTAGIEDAARAYAARVRLYPDWRDGSTPPLAEATYAVSFLDDPLLRPYLILFLLHRYRCAYETLIKEGEIVPIREYRAKYRETLELARVHPDPLVGFLAGEMDAIPGNIHESEQYTGGPVHP